MYELNETDPKDSKAVLVIPKTESDTPLSCGKRAAELCSLCKTMGLETAETVIVNIRSIRTATYIGSGKTQELKELCDTLGAGVLVFDTELSPTQQRNLENETDLCVIDRPEVIIQIFADRAATREATLQVELARLKFSLPRLTRKWTNLSQVRGGVRGGKGAGEKQLELDRRYIEKRITVLEKELETVKKTRGTQRRKRQESGIKQIAIVGYTNSGKSTLLNRLTDAGVLSEDKLFATLDTVTRKLRLPDGTQVLLTDTVGFVSNLPHHLIDSFRSTLEEAALSDALLIVCDAQNGDCEKCFDTTIEVLNSLGCENHPTLIVANKTEDEPNFFNLINAKSLELTGKHALPISARTGKGIPELLSRLSGLC